MEAKDAWERTPLLIAAIRGDISMIDLLLGQGADVYARAQESSALGLAVESGVPAMVEHLAGMGLPLEEQDCMGQAPLAKAVSLNDLPIAQALIRLGANINAQGRFESVLGSAVSKEMIDLLLTRGADPQLLSEEGRRILLGLGSFSEDELLDVSPEEYHRARTAREGKFNPEEAFEPFWLAMIRSGATAYSARHAQQDEDFPACRISRPAPPQKGGKEGPVWCAKRFGQSMTLLPDGRTVLIAGEHEDSYDPDFCIYNDVIVHEPDGNIRIFTYPLALFPPTDFHTATLVGKDIILIGCLGYADQRGAPQTQVLRLDTNTFKMERILAKGPSPGAIYGHSASLEEGHKIRISGGTLIRFQGSKEAHEENGQMHVLNLQSMSWGGPVAPPR